MKKYRIIFAGVLVVFGMMIVNAATKDTTPPTLTSISLKEPNKTYNVGDKVYLNIDANDDISGISAIYINGDVEWDPDVTGGNSGVSGYIYDIQTNPYFIIENGDVNGKYSINSVSITDNANNEVTYTNDITNKDNKYLSFDMKYSVKTDRNSIAPSLKSISIDKNSYKNGEYINIKVSVDGDYQNIDDLYINFYNKEKEYDFCVSTFFGDLYYNENENVFEASIATPSLNGEYVLRNFSISDKVGNGRYYVTDKNATKEVDPNNNWYYVEPVKFNVTGGFEKVPEIKISNIDYTFKKLIAPNVYKIGVKLDDPNDIIRHARIILGLKKDDKKEFNMATDKYIEAYLYKDENGILSGYIDINQFNDLGVYYLAEIDINTFWAQTDDHFLGEIDKNLNFDKVDLFEIIEDETYEVVSSTTDKELIDKIKNASDNAKIAINSTSSSKISKEVFEAIKGTNKTIYIESGGIQWVFNGKDIKITKEIDTSVYFNYLYTDAINEKLNNVISKGLVINFANNGELPGKALIRVKTDYALRDYLGIENLFVYHYINEDNYLFNRVAKNISMTEDGYLEFYVDHNSVFVIADKEVENKYVSDSVKDLALNDNSIKIEDKNNTNNKIIYVIISCITVLLIVIALVIILKKKKKTKKGLNK